MRMSSVKSRILTSFSSASLISIVVLNRDNSRGAIANSVLLNSRKIFDVICLMITTSRGFIRLCFISESTGRLSSDMKSWSFLTRIFYRSEVLYTSLRPERSRNALVLMSFRPNPRVWQGILHCGVYLWIVPAGRFRLR